MPHIRHELIIGAPVEKVYNAIAGQEGLSAWWTPDAQAKPEPESVARFPFGPEYFKEMEIMELKPNEAVKWVCIAGANEWLDTTISFKLLPGDKDALLNAHPELADQLQQLTNTDNITLLIFQHDNWQEYTPMFSECNYTWGRFLRSLKRFCETGKGRPWPNQHRVE
ncbi:SRPBCC family protein [Longitalea luteola]|uniref:SRPBCC family protein n=1 Tax=Longitalea luteola TaxID=2812563 RepID=UPI001A96A27E|nr:SRPBCC domain-containing protein [Longitalea luteola]